MQPTETGAERHAAHKEPCALCDDRKGIFCGDHPDDPTGNGGVEEWVDCPDCVATADLLDPSDPDAVLLADIGDGGDLAGWPTYDRDAFKEAIVAAYGSTAPHLDGGYTGAELGSRLTIRLADATPAPSFG